MTSTGVAAQVVEPVITTLANWVEKIQYGTVPAWFGGLSLLLAFVLFLRDRRKSDREQIDKVAVWVTTTYERLPPKTDRIEEIEFTLHARNANEVPIDVHLVAFEVETSWWVPDGNDPDNDRTLQTYTRVPNTRADRYFPSRFLLPPNSSLPEQGQKCPVEHQAPERAVQLDPIDGARTTVRWFLAIDNAGGRWEVCPGRGRRARRIRWYSRRREYYPPDWRPPVWRWFEVLFYQSRDRIRRARQRNRVIR